MDHRDGQLRSVARVPKLFLRAAAVAASWTSFPVLAAVDATWITPTNGTWSNSLRWSTSVFPNNGSPAAGDFYNVQIGARGPVYRVMLDSSGARLA